VASQRMVLFKNLKKEYDEKLLLFLKKSTNLGRLLKE
jgi:hypothetical protein